MEEYIQLSLFGKTSPEPFQATEEKTSAPCWKSLQAQQKGGELLFLNLQRESGEKQATLKEIDGALRGESLMLNFGECPSEERESRLSWILEENVPEKYYLSARACLGILRRASVRGKELPPVLKAALERQAAAAELSEAEELSEVEEASS